MSKTIMLGTQFTMSNLKDLQRLIKYINPHAVSSLKKDGDNLYKMNRHELLEYFSVLININDNLDYWTVKNKITILFDTEKATIDYNDISKYANKFIKTLNNGIKRKSDIFITMS